MKNYQILNKNHELKYFSGNSRRKEHDFSETAIKRYQR